MISERNCWATKYNLSFWTMETQGHSSTCCIYHIMTKFAKQIYVFNIPFTTEMFTQAPHTEPIYDLGCHEHLSWSNLFVLGSLCQHTHTAKGVDGPNHINALKPEYQSCKFPNNILNKFCVKIRNVFNYHITELCPHGSNWLGRISSNNYLAPNR